MPSSGTYTLSLHDALPISAMRLPRGSKASTRMWASSLLKNTEPSPPRVTRKISPRSPVATKSWPCVSSAMSQMYLVLGSKNTDRKSTRLNSSHSSISYAVFRHLHSFPTRRSSDLGNEIASGIESQHADVGFVALEKHRAFAAAGNAENFAPIAGGNEELALRVQCHVPDVFGLGIEKHRSEEHTSELQSQFHLVCRLPAPTLFPYTTLFRSRQ